MFKSPANERIHGVIDVETAIGSRQQDLLNPLSVNVIRAFPGRGIVVWGARTLSSDDRWRYVNVRRLFIFLEASIRLLLAVGGVRTPTTSRLWSTVEHVVADFPPCPVA